MTTTSRSRCRRSSPTGCALQAEADPFGVEQARGQLHRAYGVLEQAMEAKTWAIGDDFTLADCAAAPALFYANTVAPFEAAQRNLPAYLDRLMARASFARVLQEAQPYFELFPMEKKPRIVKTRPDAAR